MSRSDRARRDGETPPPGGADASARQLVLGTAGHIDHGKTALVRALTGVDTDRLPEEKARAITIELGFAPLDLEPGLRVGVVDVPGHEGLVRTMVAGAMGIDLLLLVVAADEGVMPQTREHLAIAELLGLRHAVVALSKVDAAGPEVASLAAEEVRAVLAGTPLAAAPIVPVSAATGEGLDALREALARLASRCTAAPTRHLPPRLWIDRAFEMRGFGAVVTGTLTGGGLRVGDRVEILPEGLSARVRGLQRFGERFASVTAGGRCAVNLQGVAVSALRRGALLTAPGSVGVCRIVDVELQWLSGSPPLGRRPASVELLTGTSAVRARVAPIATQHVEPGGTAFARLHLDGGALPLLPGDRFILRGFSASPRHFATLGGGRVLDAAPPRRRRGDPDVAAGLERLARGAPADGVALRVERTGFSGLERGRLTRETGLASDELERLLQELGGRVFHVGGDALLAREAVEALEQRCLEALASFHAAEPLRPGMPRGALRGALPENLPVGAFECVLERLAAAGAIAVEDERVRARAFAPRLASAQRSLAERVVAEAREAGLEPPTSREWCQRLGIGDADLQDLLAHLEREGMLVRARGDLFFHREAVDGLRRRLVSYLDTHGALDTAAYKELIGTSRKWAVPLMELFDGERLTLRRGDVRVLRGRRRAGD